MLKSDLETEDSLLQTHESLACSFGSFLVIKAHSVFAVATLQRGVAVTLQIDDWHTFLQLAERNVTPGVAYRHIRASDRGRHFLTFLSPLRRTERERCRVPSSVVCGPTRTRRQACTRREHCCSAELCVCVILSVLGWNTISGCGQRIEGWDGNRHFTSAMICRLSPQLH